jgi:hypothetical protein
LAFVVGRQSKCHAERLRQQLLRVFFNTEFAEIRNEFELDTARFVFCNQ